MVNCEKYQFAFDKNDNSNTIIYIFSFPKWSLLQMPLLCWCVPYTYVRLLTVVNHCRWVCIGSNNLPFFCWLDFRLIVYSHPPAYLWLTCRRLYLLSRQWNSSLLRFALLKSIENVLVSQKLNKIRIQWNTSNETREGLLEHINYGFYMFFANYKVTALRLRATCPYRSRKPAVILFKFHTIFNVFVNIWGCCDIDKQILYWFTYITYTKYNPNNSYRTKIYQSVIYC